MKRTFINTLLLSAAVILLSYNIPTGWYKGGSQKEAYDIGVDNGAGQSGGNAGTIKSIAVVNGGFGTLMQAVSADKFRGKRVRMTGYMRTESVSDWAGFWFRVDGSTLSESLAFDNMHDAEGNGKDRSVKGTTPWHQYEIVLDVDKKAAQIAFGALLAGTGQVWFSDIKFEVVNNSVPTTGFGKHKTPYSPYKKWIKNTKDITNLDFN